MPVSVGWQLPLSALGQLPRLPVVPVHVPAEAREGQRGDEEGLCQPPHLRSPRGPKGQAERAVEGGDGDDSNGQGERRSDDQQEPRRFATAWRTCERGP